MLNFCTQSCVSQSQQPIWGAHSAIEAATAVHVSDFIPRKLLMAKVYVHTVYDTGFQAQALLPLMRAKGYGEGNTH